MKEHHAISHQYWKTMVFPSKGLVMITRTNKYGNKLIELWKRCSVHIANGWLDKNRFIANTSCKDARLVDYLILYPNVFNVVLEFEGVDFNQMFSDVDP